MAPGWRRDLARFREAWDAVPDDSKLRRLGFSAVVAVGLTVTMARSLVFSLGPGIPWKMFPDARIPALFAVAFLVGIYASAGRRQRRQQLLYMTLFVALAFHLESATIHWFVEYDGSITGQRVDVIAVGASVLAIGAVLALHAEVEAWDFARDVRARGADAAAADASGRALADAGLARAGAVAGFGVAVAVLVAVAEQGLGDVEVGPALVALAVGTSLLVAAAWLLLRAGRASAGP